MPVSKAALTRFQVIDACLSSRLKKIWSSRELLEKLQEHDLFVSQRTLESDLETMRFDERINFQAPIVFCRKRKGYFYSDPSYSINNVHLNQHEVSVIQEVLAVIEPYSDFCSLGEAPGILRKVTVMPDEDPSESFTVPPISFDNDFGCPKELVNQCVQLIRSKTAAEMTVSAYLDARVSHTLYFHACHLHQVDGGWFLGGVADDECHLQTAYYHLYQIKTLVPIERTFISLEEAHSSPNFRF